ncbi:hypothetical protein ACPPVW_12385 [Leifsonia sp. McL0607]|uniref:hypothetical protein n=1 Tax=Leifsonia sp. McL0607 TaxID=3415672 RepID=UPI003CE9DBEB
MAEDPTPVPRVQLSAAPVQQLPSNISLVVKESGVPVETRPGQSNSSPRPN